jgi:2-keto-4-pentenoate hydratase/2-oxohepta-3-ene-1,7-dioic acid hydratase in catechol pathway
MLLGKRHEILAYTLANDLTAISIEACGRTSSMDGTYEGKVWDGSGSLGPHFIPASTIKDPDRLTVGLRIERKGYAIYDQAYCTSRRLRSFREIPGAIVTLYKSFGDFPPPSKRIRLDYDGFLPPGTVIMLGTGLIVKEKHSCIPGDNVTVYCSAIGELTNEIS